MGLRDLKHGMSMDTSEQDAMLETSPDAYITGGEFFITLFVFSPFNYSIFRPSNIRDNSLMRSMRNRIFSSFSVTFYSVFVL